MSRIAVAASLLGMLVFAVGLAGCSPNAPDASSTPPTGQSTKDHGEHERHGDHDHGAHSDDGKGGQSAMEKMKEELAKLSPEDAASAEKQHVCPVSGEMLGAMGAPQKIDVNGQQVWICCDDCRDKLLASPDKYLAKLKKD